MGKLLTREQFRSQTLERNKGKCCVPACVSPAVDAHHILNRNLFVQPHEYGGYFLENGAQLCSQHHYDAEITVITVEQLRQFCDITNPAIPEQLNSQKSYDCWGNQILDNGYRVKGNLFTDEGCQKALKNAGFLWKLVDEPF